MFASARRWWLAAVVLALDLVSKSLAAAFGDDSSSALVDPVTNGELMLGVGDAPLPVLIALSTAAAVGGALAATSLERRGWLPAWVLPVGIAGFLGNLVDRVLLGHVRDWLVVGPTRWNLADVALLIAIVLVLTAGIRAVSADTPEGEGVTT